MYCYIDQLTIICVVLMYYVCHTKYKKSFSFCSGYYSKHDWLWDVWTDPTMQRWIRVCHYRRDDVLPVCIRVKPQICFFILCLSLWWFLWFCSPLFSFEAVYCFICCRSVAVARYQKICLVLFSIRCLKS